MKNKTSRTDFFHPYFYTASGNKDMTKTFLREFSNRKIMDIQHKIIYRILFYMSEELEKLTFIRLVINLLFRERCYQNLKYKQKNIFNTKLILQRDMLLGCIKFLKGMLAIWFAICTHTYIRYIYLYKLNHCLIQFIQFTLI